MVLYGKQIKEVRLKGLNRINMKNKKIDTPYFSNHYNTAKEIYRSTRSSAIQNFFSE